jgi:hypothetical protein
MSLGKWQHLRKLAEGTSQFVISQYVPASWWHPDGRYKMLRRLELLGMPWLKGWLFFTLTVDQDRFSSPIEAFEKGQDRIRRVIDRLRSRGYSIRRYFFKLELQGNGWPHWHVCVDTRRYIAEEELERIWGYGFVDVKRVKPNKWRYLFKYVVKGNGPIPDWVLDYPKRIRVFQTSVGFFEKRGGESGDERPVEREVSDQRGSLREKFDRWETKGRLRRRSEIEKVYTVDLVGTFYSLLLGHVAGGRRVLNHYTVPLTEEEIRTWIRTNK